MLRAEPQLSRLKGATNELIPDLAIHVDSESSIWTEPSTANIDRLYTSLRLQHPEAGTRYWRSRGWGLLIWQPIYLAVIATHKCQLTLPLNEMGQNFPVSGIPSGILFRRGQFKLGEINDCVKGTAEDLMRGCQQLHTCWSESGLTRKCADRMVADCVLSALLMVYPQQAEEAETFGHLWLTTMGLQSAAGFIRYKNHAGEARLALLKRGCCFRYLCHGCSPCAICPRQTEDERLMRLRLAGP